MNRIMRALSGCAIALAVTSFTAAPALARDKPANAEHHEKAHQGQTKHHKKGHQRAQKMMKHWLFKDINLTSQQKDQVKKIGQDQRKQARQWHKAHGKEMRDLWKQMREAKRKGDKDGVKEAKHKMQELRQDAPNMKKFTDKISDKVLTKDQRAQFEKNIKAMKDHFRDMARKHRQHGKHGKNKRHGRRGDHGNHHKNADHSDHNDEGDNG